MLSFKTILKDRNQHHGYSESLNLLLNAMSVSVVIKQKHSNNKEKSLKGTWTVKAFSRDAQFLHSLASHALFQHLYNFCLLIQFRHFFRRIAIVILQRQVTLSINTKV